MQTTADTDTYDSTFLTENEIPLSRFELSNEKSRFTLEHFKNVQQTQGQELRRLKTDTEDPPDPFPSKRIKSELFNEQNYSHVTSLIKTIFPTKTDTWQTFTDRLMVDTNCRTDLDRLRVAFEWVGKSDPTLVNVSNKEDRPANSPLDIFLRCRNEKLFSALFQRILAYSGLAYELIKGFKKGTSYNIGHHIDDNRDKGLWFAVYIDGEWRFIDAHWGCCHVVGGESGEWNRISEEGIDKAKTSQGTVMYTCNEAYFMTDPYKMIFKHFPERPEWQLLATPITMEDFEELPYMFPDYMEDVGLKLITHWKSVILIPESGEVNIWFEEVGNKNEYKALLYIHTNSMENIDTVAYNSKEIKLSRFLAVKRDNNKICISIYPPKIGKYLLVVQGLKSGVDESLRTDLIHYVMHCKNLTKAADPMPDTHTTEWGLGAQAEAIGVTPINHTGAEIKLEDGEETIHLQANTDLDYNFELRDRENDTPLGGNNVIVWKHKGVDMVHVMAPDSGVFGLSILAKAQGSSEYKIVGDYLLEAYTNAEDSEIPFPPSSSFGILGFIDNALESKYGVRPLDSNPYINTDASDLVLPWKIDEDSKTILTAQLFFFDGHEFQNKNDFSIVNNTPEGCDLNVRFEENGVHVLKVFAQNKKSAEKENIFNYFIRSTGHLDTSILPFPDQGDIWSSNYALRGPSEGLLLQNTTKDLAVLSKDKVKEVYVKLPDGTKQNLSEKNNFLWQHSMGVGNRGEVMEVFVVDNDGNEHKILKFKAASQEDFNKRKEKIEQRNAERAKRRQARKAKKEAYLRKLRGEPEPVQEPKPEPEPQSRSSSASSTSSGRRRREAASTDSSPAKKSEISEPPSPEKIRGRSFSASSKSSDDENDRKSSANKEERKRKKKEQQALRHLLKEALRSKKESKIKTAVSACEEYEDYEDRDSLLEYGKKYLEMLSLQKKLVRSIEKSKKERKCEPIAQAIKAIDEANLPDELLDSLTKDIEKARALYKRFERTSRIKIKPLVLDEKSMLELRNYASPDNDIHLTVIATLLLLGFYEKRTKKWKRCQPIIKTLKVSDFNTLDPAFIHPTIAVRTKELLQNLDSAEIAIKSAAAAAYFDWAIHLSNSVIATLDDNAKVKPATIRKQKKIFNVSVEEDGDLDWEDKGIRKKTAIRRA